MTMTASLIVATSQAPSQFWHTAGEHVQDSNRHEPAHCLTVVIPSSMDDDVQPIEVYPTSHFMTRQPFSPLRLNFATMPPVMAPRLGVGDILVLDTRVLRRQTIAKQQQNLLALTFCQSVV